MVFMWCECSSQAAERPGTFYHRRVRGCLCPGPHSAVRPCESWPDGSGRKGGLVGEFKVELEEVEEVGGSVFILRAEDG
ncbi:MAG: hypothetical protein NVSMB62_25330 [Acidobacteriaceae bacterium]